MKRDGRRILLEGIRNCRDLGGLVTKDGRSVREGLLLRSARLTNATANDIRDLKEQFHLSEILDLRNAFEQEEHPDVPFPGVPHIDLPIIDFNAAGITHEELAKLPAYERWPGMAELYSRFITEKPLNHNLAKAVRRILTHDFDRGAVLWHCYGGKDRCGMAAALTLSVLGVPYESIKEDYMLTNLEGKPAAEKAYRSVLERGGSQKEADFEYDANIARETYLDSAFDAMEKIFGGPVPFLMEMGGITQEEMELFQNKVTESV